MRQGMNIREGYGWNNRRNMKKRKTGNPMAQHNYNSNEEDSSGLKNRCRQKL